MTPEQQKSLIRLLNIAKVEMLDWFNESVIGYPDYKQRLLVKIKKTEIEESEK